MTVETAQEVAIAVLQNDVGWIKAKVGEIAETVAEIGAAGLPRRVAALETHDCEQDDRLETLETSQLGLAKQIEGAVRVLKIGAAVVTIVASAASLLVALQALGAIR